MSYIRYLCLFAYIVVQHILCCVFVFSSFFVPYVARFYELSISWLVLRYSLKLNLFIVTKR